MVYEKAKSGDPDFDDKQPIEQHAGRIVTAPDGRDVIMSESNGPTDPATGEHVNLDEAPDARDNRPAPGEVATETSEVQTYTAEDTPAADRTSDEDVVQPAPAKAAKSTSTSRTSGK